MREQALQEIAEAADLSAVQALRVRYLGKKGELTRQLKTLGTLAPDERRARQGGAINALKGELEDALRGRREALEREAVARQLGSERVDVTLPGYSFPVGGLHLLTRVTNHLTDVFRSMGYDVVVGPELETDEYNFQKLNFPDEHPARDTQDTFWTEDGRLLRTQTSPMQVRYMQDHEPPFKIVVPGKVFRNEAVDATHEAMFHQLEALVVGEHVTMADLHGAIAQMARGALGAGDQDAAATDVLSICRTGRGVLGCGGKTRAPVRRAGSSSVAAGWCIRTSSRRSVTRV